MIAVIFNPTARGERAKSFLSLLESLGSGILRLPTEGPGHAIHLAIEAVRRGSTTVVAAGGDGTVNEVLQGLAPLDSVREGGVRFAILPWGTVNVFARELGIPFDFPGAWKVATEGWPRIVDILFADHFLAGIPSRRYFAQLGGAGLDSRALSRVRWDLKKRIGQLAYVWAGIQALVPPRPRVSIFGPELLGSGELVLFGNGRYYGGRYPVFPEARLDDALIDIMAMDRTHPWALLRAYWHLQRDTFRRCPSVKHFQGPRFEIRCNRHLPFELEGDNLGVLPATLGVLPNALTVMAAPGGDC